MCEQILIWKKGGLSDPLNFTNFFKIAVLWQVYRPLEQQNKLFKIKCCMEAEFMGLLLHAKFGPDRQGRGVSTGPKIQVFVKSVSEGFLTQYGNIHQTN